MLNNMYNNVPQIVLGSYRGSLPSFFYSFGPLSPNPTVLLRFSVNHPIMEHRFYINTVEIEKAHAVQLEQVLKKTNFDAQSSSEFYTEFVYHSQNGRLNRESYTKVWKSLVKSNEEELEYFMDELFDHFGDTEVSAVELAAGFSVFAAGSKSDKLATAFQYFDTEGKDTLSTTQLWCFLKSVMTMLLALFPDAVPNESLSAFVESDMFAIMKNLRHESFLVDKEYYYSFQDFGDWYNNGGYKQLVWLELLDLKKWAFILPSFSSMAMMHGPKTVPVCEDFPNFCLENQIVLEFALPNVHQMLYFVNRDLVQYASFQSISQFNQLSLDQLYQVYAGGIDSLQHTVDIAYVYAIVDELLLLAYEDKDTQVQGVDFVVDTLQRMFYAYNRNGLGEVCAAEYMCALVLFTTETKSEKLAFAFQCFDFKERGTLSRRGIWLFLRSILTALFHLGNGSIFSQEETAKIVDKVCIHCTANIFAKFPSAMDISFEEFATWYSKGGYSIVPWLELLDCKKWPSATTSMSRGAFSNVQFNAGQNNVNDIPTLLAFQFMLVEHDETILKIKIKDVSLMHKFQDILKLHEHSIYDMHAKFTECAVKTNTNHRMLNMASFQDFIQSILPKEQLLEEDQRFLWFHISRLFDLFDIENSGQVDTHHVLCALSMLNGGTKSEKLDFLFQCLSLNDEEIITRHSLFELFRCILMFLMFFTQHYRSYEIAVKGASVLTARIMYEADTASTDAITFQEFADWYGSHGCVDSPWIELLDVAKWPGKDALEDRLKSTQPSTFTFSISDESSALHYSDDDVSHFLHRLAVSGLRNLDISSLYEVVMGHASSVDTIDLDSYMAAHEITLNAVETEKDRSATSLILLRLFHIYNYGSTDRVKLNELCCGLTILGHGSKSQKLLLSFMLFTGEEGKLNSTVSQDNLYLYLRALLLGFMTISSEHYEDDNTSVLNFQNVLSDAHDSIREAMDQIVSEVVIEPKGRISFADFSAWYNTGGYQVLSWIELLDISKWQPKATPKASNITQFIVKPVGRSLNPKTSTQVEQTSGPLMDFAISDESAGLQLLTNNVEVLQQFLYDTQLYTMDAELLADQYCSTNGEINSAKDLLECITKRSQTGDFSESTLAVMSDVFSIFENDVLGEASTAVVICGLLVFTDGTLEGKLKCAMRLVSESKYCGKIIHRTKLQHCFRIFLSVLYVLGSPLSDDVIKQSAKLGAEDAMRTFVGDIAIGAPNYDTSVESFVQWFDDRGHHILPWMELVVLHQWPVALKLAEPKL